MSKVYPSITGLASGLSTVGLSAIDPNTGTVLRARSTTGVTESSVEPGTYYLLGGLNAAVALTAWDIATVDQGGELLVAQAPSSLPVVLPAGGVSPVVTASFFIKRGDTEPIIFAITELDSRGVPQVQDVTGWTGKFKLRTTPDVSTVIINQPFYISDVNGNLTTDGTAGLVAYAWPNTGDTDREGTFLAEFECHRADGTKKTYPTTSDLTREYITVQFVPDLDDAGSY